jgi:hypothetical protein
MLGQRIGHRVDHGKRTGVDQCQDRDQRPGFATAGQDMNVVAPDHAALQRRVVPADPDGLIAERWAYVLVFARAARAARNLRIHLDFGQLPGGTSQTIDEHKTPNAWVRTALGA